MGFLPVFLALISTGTIRPAIASIDPWYTDHYLDLTKDINGAIAKWPSDEQSFLVLPGMDTYLKVFPVAVNEADQPTIIAGLYGQGRFILAGNWDQFYTPQDDDEKQLLSNTLSWLSGDPSKESDDVKVAIRDYSKMYGHEDDSPRYVKPEDLDPATYDVYSAYAGSYGSYSWNDAEVDAVLRWVGEDGKGLMLVGVIDWTETAKGIVEKASVNKIAKEFGAMFGYRDQFPKGYVPNSHPPGVEAFFYPNLDGISFNDEMVAKRFGIDAPLVANKETTLNSQYDDIFQLCGELTSDLNKQETSEVYSKYIYDMFPVFLMRNDIVSDAYLPAWDIDHFPYDVNDVDGSKKAPKFEFDFEEDTTNDVHYENEVWFPTGYYAKGGDIVKMTFDGPLLNSGAYVQIGQHVIDHSSQEGRSRLITQYQDIVQVFQKFSNPWGGPIYITLPSPMKIKQTKVTIEGAYKMVTFKLDKMKDKDFIEEVKSTKVPWVDLQAPGWISFIPTTEFAKTMTEPTKIMDFWRDEMKAVTKFAAYGNKRPKMERFIYDAAAIGVMYGGYPMEANPSRVDYYLTYENFHDRYDYPWGAYHEIGHGHQESVWTMGFSECTVNWFSIVMSMATKGITDEYWTYTRTHGLNDFNNQGKNFATLGNWVCLDSYALLGEKFGWDSYTKTMDAYQNNETLWNTSGEARYGAWALEYSKVVKKNVCDHFKWFGWPIDDATMTKCHLYDDLGDLVGPYLEPKVENTAACDPGWFSYGDACFYLSPHAADDWDDAKEHCEDLGGELASCLSKWEAYHFGIKHAYRDEDSDLATYYWIGLRDRDKDYKLRWMNGHEVDDENIPFDHLHNPYRPEPYTKSRSPGECAYYKNGYVRMGSCGFGDINVMCKKGGAKC